MIDLKKPLPSTIDVGGVAFPVRTDFRVWIEFGEYLRNDKAWAGIFEKNVPKGDSWHRPAVMFYQSPNEIPRESKATGRLLDYTIDGELIVASFQQAYGVDLTSCDMHWHRFKALLSGLPDDTILSKVIGYRAYSPTKKKHEDMMMERKAAWALESKNEDDFSELVGIFEGM